MGAVHELIERDRLYAGGEWVEPENGRTSDVITPSPRSRSDARRSPHARVVVGAGRCQRQWSETTAGGSVVVYVMALRLPEDGARIELAEVIHFGADGTVVEIKPHYFDSDAVQQAASSSRSS